MVPSLRLVALIMLLVGIAPLTVDAQDATPSPQGAATGDAGAAGTPTVSGAGRFIARFDDASGEFTEGVAVADDGTVYASLSPLGQLVRIPAGGGEHEIVGTIDGIQDGDLGLIGLTVAPDGTVCGGVGSANADAHGVWCFDVASGDAERVPGTEAIGLPNGLDFDDAGNLYVADSPTGAVWLVPAGGTAEEWVQDPVLEGDGSAGFPFPLGANVPAIDAAGTTMYVSVTEAGTLVAIPIAEDGGAGTPETVAEFRDGDRPLFTDGVAIDAAGNIYVTLVLANAVMRVTPDGMVKTVATAEDGLDGPASVAIGPNADGAESLFLANYAGALGGMLPPGPGPGVVMVSLED